MPYIEKFEEALNKYLLQATETVPLPIYFKYFNNYSVNFCKIFPVVHLLKFLQLSIILVSNIAVEETNLTALDFDFYFVL